MSPDEAYQLGRSDTWAYIGQRLLEIWTVEPEQSLAKGLRMASSDSVDITQKLIAAHPCLSHLHEYRNGIMSVLNKLNAIHLG